MITKQATHLVIIGAGISGLCTAGALSPYFKKVTILERDILPEKPMNRKAVPQGHHNHSLLAGGGKALFGLFPKLEQAMIQAGVTTVRMNQDVWEEHPNSDHGIQHNDYGYYLYTLTRPLLEFLLRQEVKQLPNVEIKQQCRVRTLNWDQEKKSVTGVSYHDSTNEPNELTADFVVDASAYGKLLLNLLEEQGFQSPKRTSIEVNIGYASTFYKIPDNISNPWRAVLTCPNNKKSSKAALLFPMEGNRWILGLTGSWDERPPGNEKDLLEFVNSFHTKTIYKAITNTERIADIHTYGFKQSILNHYHEMKNFPDGVLPIGDILCRCNPIYGQGITVVALEAEILGKLFDKISDLSDPNLSSEYFKQIWPVISSAWDMAAIRDLQDERTVGERPPDFQKLVDNANIFERLVHSNPEVARLSGQVLNFLQPSSVLNSSEIIKKAYEQQY